MLVQYELNTRPWRPVALRPSDPGGQRKRDPQYVVSVPKLHCPSPPRGWTTPEELYEFGPPSVQHRVLAAPLSPPQWSETDLYLHATLSKSVYTSNPESYTFFFVGMGWEGEGDEGGRGGMRFIL